MSDLASIRHMYWDMVEEMKRCRMQIWDDVYPCEYLEKDIAGGCFYIIEENGKIQGGFALCDSASGEDEVKWGSPSQKAFYIDRLGVCVNSRGKGIGSLLLQEALRLVREKRGEYLRLFVVDSNIPAIRLYEKNGFRRAQGVYEEKIDDELVLRQYGFEIKIPKLS